MRFRINDVTNIQNLSIPCTVTDYFLSLRDSQRDTRSASRQGDPSLVELDRGSLSPKLDLAMGKSEALSLAVSAIQNLRELRGSTSRDIINYIAKAHRLDQAVVTKQVQASLRRGVAYGILKREKGHYTFPMETGIAGQEIAAQEIGLIEMCAKRRSSKRNNFRKNRRCGRPGCGRRGRKSCPCGTRKNKSGNKEPKSGNNADSKNVDELFGETFEVPKKKRGRRTNAFY